jgi:hypothetical protein
LTKAMRVVASHLCGRPECTADLTFQTVASFGSFRISTSWHMPSALHATLTSATHNHRTHSSATRSDRTARQHPHARARARTRPHPHRRPAPSARPAGPPRRPAPSARPVGSCPDANGDRCTCDVTVPCTAAHAAGSARRRRAHGERRAGLRARLTTRAHGYIRCTTGAAKAVAIRRAVSEWERPESRTCRLR